MNSYISILDVGHGNSAIVVDGNAAVVVDAGPGAALLEFLQEQHIERVEAILISHADDDHIAGLISVVESETVEIGLVRVNTDSAKGTKVWDDLVYLLDKRASQITFEVSLTEGNSGNFGCEHFFFQIVAPSQYLAAKGPGSTDRSGRKLTSNSNSVVIRVMNGDKPIALFAGDLDEIGMTHLFESRNALPAPVLVFPHHGGRLGRDHSAEYICDFCQRVSPSVVVFSIGRGRHGNPREDTVRGIRQCSDDIRILCTQLSENCAHDAPSTVASHLLEGFARGKLRNHCCAGTIRIVPKTDGVDIHPDEASHQLFISQCAPRALCARR